MNAPKILSVRPLKKKRLSIKFANKVEKVYDCAPWIERVEIFKALNNEAFFKTVKVDAGGYGISWNDKLDLSEYELWVNSKEKRGTNRRSAKSSRVKTTMRQ